MNIRPCIIEGCTRQTGQSGTARGYCHKHYRAFQRYGDPLGGTVDFSRLSKPDLAYAAGFIDADGSLILERSVDRRHSLGIRHVPRVNGTNADLRPLEFLRELFGGVVYTHKPKTPHPHFTKVKRQYVWAVTGRTAVACAEAILPYLKRKKQQALVLVAFRDDALWSKGGVNVTISDSEFQRREQLVSKMRGLNGSVNGEEKEEAL